MKIRNGFVSNSSSSSFVISGKLDESNKLIVSIDLSSFGKVCRTEQELKDYLLEEYGKYFAEDDVYKKSLEEIKSGKSVLIGTLDNNMIEILNYINKEKCEVVYCAHWL